MTFSFEEQIRGHLCRPAHLDRARLAAQERVNPQAEAMAQFSERVNAYLALQKKVEGELSSQKETNDPERIKTHIANLAEGIRAARADAKAGDVFNGAAEQFRQIIREDAQRPVGPRRLRRDAGGPERGRRRG